VDNPRMFEREGGVGERVGVEVDVEEKWDDG
jgi:hypothetical protein